MMFAALGIWAVGIVVSTGVLSVMGERNPNTYDDSYTGDVNLNLTLAILWPVFWPCLIAYKLGRWIAR